jgi:hypothetical protein
MTQAWPFTMVGIDLKTFSKEVTMLCLLLLIPFLFTLPMALAYCEPYPYYHCQPRPRYYVAVYPGHQSNPLPAAPAGGQTNK